MQYIVLPEKVILRLVDAEDNPVRICKVLFSIRAFTTGRKNDFYLAPFASDDEGVAHIRKGDLVALIDAAYDCGLMDYEAFEICDPSVQIEVMSPEAVERALKSRSEVWTMLLGGEPKRWATIEDLRNLYRSAANTRVSAQPIRTLWDGRAQGYDYKIVAQVQ